MVNCWTSSLLRASDLSTNLFVQVGTVDTHTNRLLAARLGFRTVDGRNPKQLPGMVLKPCQKTDIYVSTG